MTPAAKYIVEIVDNNKDIESKFYSQEIAEAIVELDKIYTTGSATCVGAFLLSKFNDEAIPAIDFILNAKISTDFGLVDFLLSDLPSKETKIKVFHLLLKKGSQECKERMVENIWIMDKELLQELTATLSRCQFAEMPFTPDEIEESSKIVLKKAKLI